MKASVVMLWNPFINLQTIQTSFTRNCHKQWKIVNYCEALKNFNWDRNEERDTITTESGLRKKEAYTLSTLPFINKQNPPATVRVERHVTNVLEPISTESYRKKLMPHFPAGSLNVADFTDTP